LGCCNLQPALDQSIVLLPQHLLPVTGGSSYALLLLLLQRWRRLQWRQLALLLLGSLPTAGCGLGRLTISPCRTITRHCCCC
jgi:hypothetical protein